MKSKILTVLFLVIFAGVMDSFRYKENGTNAISPKGNFAGDWSSKNYSKVESLELHLHLGKDSIKGSFCAVMDYGKLMDCDLDDSNEIGIRGKITSSRVALINIRSESDSMGKAKLTLLDKNTIKWEMIKAPNGICNIPFNIILYKTLLK